MYAGGKCLRMNMWMKLNEAKEMYRHQVALHSRRNLNTSANYGKLYRSQMPVAALCWMDLDPAARSSSTRHAVRTIELKRGFRDIFHPSSAPMGVYIYVDTLVQHFSLLRHNEASLRRAYLSSHTSAFTVLP